MQSFNISVLLMEMSGSGQQVDSAMTNCVKIIRFLAINTVPLLAVFPREMSLNMYVQ